MEFESSPDLSLITPLALPRKRGCALICPFPVKGKSSVQLGIPVHVKSTLRDYSETPVDMRPAFSVISTSPPLRHLLALSRPCSRADFDVYALFHYFVAPYCLEVHQDIPNGMKRAISLSPQSLPHFQKAVVFQSDTAQYIFKGTSLVTTTPFVLRARPRNTVILPINDSWTPTRSTHLTLEPLSLIPSCGTELRAPTSRITRKPGFWGGMKAELMLPRKIPCPRRLSTSHVATTQFARASQKNYKRDNGVLASTHGFLS